MDRGKGAARQTHLELLLEGLPHTYHHRPGQAQVLQVLWARPPGLGHDAVHVARALHAHAVVVGPDAHLPRRRQLVHVLEHLLLRERHLASKLPAGHADPVVGPDVKGAVAVLVEEQPVLFREALHGAADLLADVLAPGGALVGIHDGHPAV